MEIKTRDTLNLPPIHVLGTAEEVSPEVLHARMRRNETRRKPAGLFSSAWSYTEYALGKQLDLTDMEREWHLDLAQVLAGNIIKNNKVTQDIRLGAMVLSTYLPLFKKRCFKENVTSQDVYDVYTSLASAMDYLRPLFINEQPQWRMTETTVLALAARTGQPEFMLYPGSPREESSCYQRLNHDSYFLAPGNRKLPTQQKLAPTSKEYDDTVTMVVVAPMIERALRKQYEKRKYTNAEMLNYLIDSIIADATGREDSEIGLLNHLTEAVVSHYYQALDQNIA